MHYGIKIVHIVSCALQRDKRPFGLLCITVHIKFNDFITNPNAQRSLYVTHRTHLTQFAVSILHYVTHLEVPALHLEVPALGSYFQATLHCT